MTAKSKSASSPQSAEVRVHVSPRTRHGAALTAKNLLSKPPGDYTDGAVAGLTLRVLPSGARLWACATAPVVGPAGGRSGACTWGRSAVP